MVCVWERQCVKESGVSLTISREWCVYERDSMWKRVVSLSLSLESGVCMRETVCERERRERARGTVLFCFAHKNTHNLSHTHNDTVSLTISREWCVCERDSMWKKEDTQNITQPLALPLHFLSHTIFLILFTLFYTISLTHTPLSRDSERDSVIMCMREIVCVLMYETE